MGVADRSYMRGRAAPPHVAFGTSWTLRLILLLVLVHVAVKGGRGWFRVDLEDQLMLSRDALRHGRIWTLLTAALVHADTWHLVFNCIGLWFFGKLVEETVGSAKFLLFVLIAAVVSHIPFVLAAGEREATVGASGVVVAAIVFAAFHYPSLPVVLIVLPMKLWQLAALYVAIDVLGVVERSGPIDHWTHLGGAAYGFLAHRFGVFPTLRLPRRSSPQREPGPFAQGNSAREVDRILDKINANGIASLTDAERDFLKRSSGGRQH